MGNPLHLILPIRQQVPRQLNLASRYNKASVFFDFDTPGTGETYYWDDMTFGGEGGSYSLLVPRSASRPAIPLARPPLVPVKPSLAAGPNNAEQADIEYRLF